jgi:LPS-assembly protein
LTNPSPKAAALRPADQRAEAAPSRRVVGLPSVRPSSSCKSTPGFFRRLPSRRLPSLGSPRALFSVLSIFCLLGPLFLVLFSSAPVQAQAFGVRPSLAEAAAPPDSADPIAARGQSQNDVDFPGPDGPTLSPSVYGLAEWPEDVPQPGPFPEEAFPAAAPDLSLYYSSNLTSGADSLPDAPTPGERVRLEIDDGQSPVVIEADEARHDNLTRRIDFIGNVVITRDQDVFSGQRALWHEPTQTAEISGEVKMSTPDFTATAARAAINLDLKLAKLYDGKAFFPKGHYYVEGDVIERQGAETIYVNEAVFTTCDGPEPSWRLKAGNLLINRGGLATASGVSFSNKWFPMFYMPYFAAPIKGERQTGFLIPEIANSKRDGFFAAAPFFWNLAEDYDLTITPVWRSSRGLAMTLEGRYNFDAGEGIWLVTYLKDDQDNLFNYRSFGSPARNSKNLYWLRTQNSWNAAGWNLNLDLDLVSDPLYLYAFRSDIDGFFNSQRLFSQYFGRTVNEELDPTRLSTFFAQKAGSDTYLRGSLTYNQDLYRRKNIDTLQNLPKIQYNIVSRPLGIGPAMPGSPRGPRLSLDLQYDFFTRRHDANSYISETGHRLAAAPSLFWNANLGSFANLKVEAASRLTAYAPEGTGPTGAGLRYSSGFKSDLSGAFDVELSTSLSRIYDFGPGAATQTLHQVTPIVSLEVVQAPDEDDLPYFDFLDRRLRRRTLRYGLKNSLTAKTPVYDPQGQLIGADYQEIMKIGIYSSYEFASNIQWAAKDWARYYTTGYFDKGQGPLEIEVESNLAQGVSTRLLSSYDGRAGKFTRHEISMNLADARGDSLALIYDYDNPTFRQGPTQSNNTSQVRGDINLNLTHGWTASISSRFDFVQNKELESYFALSYNTQCYGLSFVYTSTYDDRRVGLIFDLLGLGSIGTPTTRLSSYGG